MSRTTPDWELRYKRSPLRIRHTRGLFFGLTVCCPPLRLAKLAPLAGMTEWDSACIGGGAAGWAWVCTTDCVSS